MPMMQSPQCSFSYWDALHAEQEQPWLIDAFVRPDVYGQLVEMRSWVILGNSGSGKTALRYALKSEVEKRVSDPIFVIGWQPTFDCNVSDQVSVYQQITEGILRAFAVSIVGWVASTPERFIALSAPARWLLGWFCQHWLNQGPEFVTLAMTEQYGAHAKPALQCLLLDSYPEVYRAPVRALDVLAELTRALQRAGFDGIWLVVDDFERVSQDNPEHVSVLLGYLLGTLGLFEIDGFCIKMMVSACHRDIVLSSRAVNSYRVSVAEIQWKEPDLCEILRKRISLTLDRSISGLSEICQESFLLNLLRKYGGTRPRGWLEIAAPYVVAYGHRAEKQPLSVKECEQICRMAPPRIYRDAESRQILIGHSLVTQLSPQSMRLLEYLYDKVGQVCSRSELYYHALEGLPQEPHLGDANYQPPKIWKAAFDNVVYRLRQGIEPLPHEPVYIIHDRRSGGVCLQAPVARIVSEL